MTIENNWLERTELLLGKAVTKRLQSTSVILFGVGGVGGWCAEGLVRSGIGHLTIVDFDYVNTTNINRQIMATTHTIGLSKVEVLKTRLLEINPNLELNAIEQRYTETTANDFLLEKFDYVIDAIDSLKDKALLIRNACNSGATLLSSMGAARKIDTQKINVTEFWKVQGCALATALRRHFKENQQFPSRKFKCVYSNEMLKNDIQNTSANGSLIHITATFGFILTELVIQDVLTKVK